MWSGPASVPAAECAVCLFVCGVGTESKNWVPLFGADGRFKLENEFDAEEKTLLNATEASFSSSSSAIIWIFFALSVSPYSNNSLSSCVSLLEVMLVFVLLALRLSVVKDLASNPCFICCCC